MEGKNPKATKGGFTAKVSGEEYEPYVAPSANIKEFTVRAVVIGCVLSIIFGAANAYLALQIGMTICASIPAAVIGLAVLKGGFKNSTILENNIVQTVGSSGEALAAGVAFTLPALLLLNIDVKIVTVFVIAAIGGLLGCLLMVPLRKFLIKDEHGSLPYPEGTACAEVVAAGHEGGNNAKMLLKALGIGGLFKFITDGIALFPATIDLPLKGYLKGGAVGMDFLPSLLGAGFLVGPRICAMSLAGAVIGWVVIMPLIYFIGSMAPGLIVAPGDIPIADMDIWAIWTNYIKYIGIGAVTMGGFISLFSALPIIVKSFKGTFAAYKMKDDEVKRTEKNIPKKVLLIGVIVLLAIIAFLPVFPSVAAGSVGAIMVLIFGFIFVAVSAHLVGYVGSSSNPIVAMTIGGLLVTAVLFRIMGFNGTSGIIATIVVGSVICISIGVSGDMAQDLKTGFLLGATPKKQQYGQMIGILTSAAVMGAVIIMLNDVYGIGSQKLPAPHANMMKSIAEGVMSGNLPWAFILMGMGIAVAVWLMGGSVLPFAVGMYLPFHLSAAMMVGGAVRGIVEKSKKPEDVKAKKIEKGTLYASGLIAGDALMGVIVTALLYIGVDMTNLIPGTENAWIGFLGYAVLIAYFAWIVFSKRHEDKLEGRDLKM
ncbi:oligopeptide transporter, OPT family [Anaerovorax odorimutans]|uniref:Oligopeptide transporter, OPT family n=1 Tax=Anaerovorax odorimutans TaxID=109327 RepID=A0ABT1RK15_9FIRM|nr:oligopeptide transporter, OPT family [Anaerovorax odorimutans]MCQ4635509.1 oligopeptide transporter, OPT family [Anaerovorax odorimutans]